MIGGAGKCGSLSLAAARRAGAAATVGIVPVEHEAAQLRRGGAGRRVAIADARDPVALSDGGRAPRWAAPPTSRSSASTCPAASTARSWPRPSSGTVVFFSMATSFSAAALGAEGLAADVTMLIGNGYAPGHADLALDLLRTVPAYGRSSRPDTPGSRSDERAAPSGTDPERKDELRIARTQTAAQQLDLDPAMVRQARSLARKAGRARRQAGPHPHHGVGRARRAAAGRPAAAPTSRASRGSTGSSTPSAADFGLEHGVALPVWDALRRGAARRTCCTLAQKAAAGSVTLPACPRAATPTGRAQAPRPAGRHGHRAASTATARERERLIARSATRRTPWIYLIVATGDIYEDIPQAQAAAREGADVIAVIRSTGQSLLDYVPEGATREGYAGTYATQENFRLMRAALDEVSQRARPLRPADQLRLRPVHARDRLAGRARAARHDAQRLDVRDPLPRHQPDPHLRRPAVLAGRCTPAPGSSSTPARTTT